MVKKKDLSQHFPVEEKEFVEKMIDICRQVETTYSHKLTTFINPKQNEIAQAIANHFGVTCYSSRFKLQTELSRLILAPDYYELDSDDFEISALELIYPRKFHEIKHAQLLGTLLNQLGIKRQFLGDILVSDEKTVILIDKKFGRIVQNSVSKVAKVPVKWLEQPWVELDIKNEQDSQTKEVLVSSLRMDKIVSTAFKLSRTLVASLIESGQVKLDYCDSKQTGKLVGLDQLISVRRYGRIRIKEIIGYSKQGKLKLKIEVIRK